MTVLNLGVPFVMVLMMMTVGIELKLGDFREVIHRKRMLLGPLLLPALLLPLLASVLGRALALPPHLTAGLLLLAACPIGDIANVYTLLARGNLALSVTLNTLSCLFSVLTMAVAFYLYGHLLDQHFAFALPSTALILRLTLMVALPVLAGIGLRHWAPAWVAAQRGALRNFCIVGIAFLVVYVLVNRWSQVVADWQLTALAGMTFMVAALVIGLAMAWLLRLNASDGITVGIVFATRNVSLATAVAVTILQRIEFAEVAVVYFLVEVPLLMGVVAVYRRWRTKMSQQNLPVGAET